MIEVVLVVVDVVEVELGAAVDVEGVEVVVDVVVVVVVDDVSIGGMQQKPLLSVPYLAVVSQMAPCSIVHASGELGLQCVSG